MGKTKGRQAKRRGNGEGSISKVARTINGKTYEYWQAQISIGTDPSGRPKRKTVTASSQAELIKKMNAMKTEVDNGEYIEPTKYTVEEWCNVWLKEYCVSVKYRTREEYRRMMDNHIIPGLGGRKLAKLNLVDLQTFFNSLKNLKTGEPLSPKSVKDIYSIVHSCLDCACDNDLIRRNPSDRVKLPKVKEKEIIPLNEADIASFLKAIKGHKYESLFTFALFTGARESELCGLTWDCINFKTNEVTIKQQLQKQDGEMKLVDTKTDRAGTISVAGSIMKMLSEIRRAQLEKDAESWNNELNLVFTEKDGRYCIPHVVYLNFKKVAEAIGLPEARFHDLRHSCATALLANGVDIKTVQQTLRHASPATTQRYVHCTDEMMKAGADTMDTLFKRVKNA